MRTIEEYLTHVYQIIQHLAEVDAERYEEQILSVSRGNLRIRLRFSDGALLEISEAVASFPAIFVGSATATTIKIPRGP